MEKKGTLRVQGFRGIRGFCKDNGKENGSYYNGVIWGFVGIIGKVP